MARKATGIFLNPVEPPNRPPFGRVRRAHGSCRSPHAHVPANSRRGTWYSSRSSGMLQNPAYMGKAAFRRNQRYLRITTSPEAPRTAAHHRSCKTRTRGRTRKFGLAVPGSELDRASPQERRPLGRYAYGAATGTRSADKMLSQSSAPKGDRSGR